MPISVVVERMFLSGFQSIGARRGVFTP